MSAKLTLVPDLPDEAATAILSAPLPDVVSAQGLTGCIDDNGTCGGKLVGRGRCRKHYMRWWRATRGKQRPTALHLKAATIAERFWRKVDRRSRAECWPWTGSANRSGHGEFFVSPERGRVPAHTFAVELTVGRACPEGLEGCHRCDNPPCCNPAHVYYGTRQDNVDDMWARGRAAYGERLPQARLTERDVLAIRVRFAAGDTQPALAAEFQVSDSQISHIVNGHSWRHVGGPIKTHGRPGRRPINRKAA
ncbi:HNH endonuclease [Micromonospora sp. NPDC047730]|uniref:HNH endonuclease n=1 Tax=Micromonospora sp. NPDC047730 TaxID=3364253 RepID=UPI00371E7119